MNCPSWLVIRTSGRVIMHKSAQIQVGESGIVSKCCWAVNKGESVVLSLTVCPQNKAFTGYGLLSWVASVSLHGFLLVFIAISVNRMSSKNQTLERFHSLPTVQSDATDSYIANCSTFTSNVPFLSHKYKTGRTDSETQTYFRRIGFRRNAALVSPVKI